tara:strand:+ start:6254 stop:7243 length:990 start_codon:yes stop_codon:yes gene_type:complete
MRYLIFIVCLFCGCKELDSSKSLIHNVGFAQGTSYSIKYMSSDDYHHEIDSLLTVIDNSLSTYNTNSLLSQLNRSDTSLLLDTHFVRVFKASQNISLLSDGLFDCTVAPLVNAWGFGPNYGQEVDSIHITGLLKQVGYQDLWLRGDSLLSNPKQKKIDFNALAQGYTVDVIAELLDSNLVADYLIELGGELRAKGYNSRNKKWRVGIDKPSNKIDVNDRFQIILNLQNKSLATSGNYRNFYEKDSQIYSHTINPKTAYPVQHSLLSATVIADDCMIADAYATTFMVMGVEQAKDFLSKHPNLDAFLIFTDVDKSWESWSTEGFKSMVTK